MARELTLDEIGAIRQATTVPLEAFVHGALCVSYSGRCAISQVLKGRSANRGECAQLCRLPYDLVDGKGRIIVEGKHLLSLRDMAQHDRLEQMMAAGVSSFKIEGRLKDVGYVKNDVAYYRRAIDKVIERQPERYRRASFGNVDLTFEPAIEKSFNRGFTHYFLDQRQPKDGTAMASIDTPKSQGEYLGRALRCSRRTAKRRCSPSCRSSRAGTATAWRSTSSTGERRSRPDGNEYRITDAHEGRSLRGRLSVRIGRTVNTTP